MQTVHDLHIWALSTTQTALTVHLVKPNPAPDGDDALLARIREDLRAQHHVAHATIQLERGDAAHPCGLADSHHV